MRSDKVVKNQEGDEMYGKYTFRSEKSPLKREYYKYIYMARAI